MRTAWTCAAVGLGIVLAVGGCASPLEIRRDPVIRRIVEDAREAYSAGQAGKAVRLYRAALCRAEEMDDAGEIARCAYNLGVSLAAAGDLAQAEAFLEETLASPGVSAEQAVDAWLARAKIARSQGRKGDTAAFIVEGLKAAEGAGVREAVVQIRLFAADFLVELGQTTRARSEVDQARKEIGSKAPPAVRAQVEGAEGRLQMAEQDSEAAAGCFDREADLWKEVGRYREMAAALDAAGQAHEKNKAAGAAADRFFRAARSLYAAGDLARAQVLNAKAKRLAETGDAQLRSRIELLSRRISRESSAEAKRENAPQP